MNLDSYSREYTPQEYITLVVDGPDTWDLISPEYFGKFEIKETWVYEHIEDDHYLGHQFYARFPELIDGLRPSSCGKRVC